VSGLVVMGARRNPHPYRESFHPDCPQSPVVVVVANSNKMKLRRINQNKKQTNSKLRSLLRIDRRSTESSSPPCTTTPSNPTCKCAAHHRSGLRTLSSPLSVPKQNVTKTQRDSNSPQQLHHDRTAQPPTLNFCLKKLLNKPSVSPYFVGDEGRWWWGGGPGSVMVEMTN
jgi:hypothetical protein